MTPNELFEQDRAHTEKYVERGWKLFEEDARRSVAGADGSSEVYFAQESGMGAIKIGVTGNLDRRIVSMQGNTPHKIEVLGSVYADTRLEIYLKRRFVHARIRGEWFWPVDELVKYIEETTKFVTAKPKPIEPTK